jgi:DNA-binding transcriptional LysR family regulator
MTDVELRELRYFAAVARELSFSRAAERIGITQPPLSRAIAKLERTLGVRLFDRSTHDVTLTPAGQTLLRQTEAVFGSVSAAVRLTQRAAVTARPVVVTAKPGVAGGLLRRIADDFSARFGGPSVHIVVSPYRQQTALVRDGRADLGLLNSPFDARDLRTHVLLTERRVAALPATHPLAARTALAAADLVGEPVAVWPDATEAERAYWSGLPYRPRDQRPVSHGIRGPVVHDASELFEVVGLGQAVAVIPEWAADDHPHPGVAYRPVVDAEPAVTALAWRPDIDPELVDAFVRSARTVVAGSEAVAAG